MTQFKHIEASITNELYLRRLQTYYDDILPLRISLTVYKNSGREVEFLARKQDVNEFTLTRMSLMLCAKLTDRLQSHERYKHHLKLEPGAVLTAFFNMPSFLKIVLD